MAEVYPWQTGLWQQMVQRTQHAHAYLLHGPVGIGKRSLAQHFAHYLLCQAPLASARCGQCKSCLLVNAGTHPDFYQLTPAEDKKTVGVDEVRDLIDFIGKTAQLGGNKLILVAEPAVEEMTLAASNALLKSLEEPTRNTVLLLVSDQPSRLLPTIKSRCVQQACPQPNWQQSAQWLQAQRSELSGQEVDTLLTLAAASPLLALNLLEQNVIEQRAMVVEGFKKLLKRQATPSQLAEAWTQVSLVLLLDWMFAWTQAIMRYQLTEEERFLDLPDMAKVNQYLAQKAPKTAVLQLQQTLLEQRQKVLGKSNLNRALLLEALLGQWASLTGPR